LVVRLCTWLVVSAWILGAGQPGHRPWRSARQPGVVDRPFCTWLVVSAVIWLALSASHVPPSTGLCTWLVVSAWIWALFSPVTAAAALRCAKPAWSSGHFCTWLVVSPATWPAVSRRHLRGGQIVHLRRPSAHPTWLAPSAAMSLVDRLCTWVGPSAPGSGCWSVPSAPRRTSAATCVVDRPFLPPDWLSDLSPGQPTAPPTCEVVRLFTCARRQRTHLAGAEGQRRPWSSGSAPGWSSAAWIWALVSPVTRRGAQRAKPAWSNRPFLHLAGRQRSDLNCT